MRLPSLESILSVAERHVGLTNFICLRKHATIKLNYDDDSQILDEGVLYQVFPVSFVVNQNFLFVAGSLLGYLS